MDPEQISTVLGLATSAAGFTDKAANTISTIKGLFDGDKPPDAAKAQALLNTLANELTAANMTNVELSKALKTLHQEIQRSDEFETEKARYELFTTEQNDVVYRLKDTEANGQPIHYICPVCLNRDRLISFISGEGDFKGCQAVRDHTFRFKKTPHRPVRARMTR